MLPHERAGRSGRGTSAGSDGCRRQARAQRRSERAAGHAALGARGRAPRQRPVRQGEAGLRSGAEDCRGVERPPRPRRGPGPARRRRIGGGESGGGAGAPPCRAAALSRAARVRHGGRRLASARQDPPRTTAVGRGRTALPGGGPHQRAVRRPGRSRAQPDQPRRHAAEPTGSLG